MRLSSLFHTLTEAMSLILVFSLSSQSQESSPVPPPDAASITTLTTPVEVEFTGGGIARGSGFYYVEFVEDPTKVQGSAKLTVKRLFVVTAKHIVQPQRLKELVEFRYSFRLQNGDHFDWGVMTLDKHQLEKRLHICRDDRIDVAAIDIGDRLSEQVAKLLVKGAQAVGFSEIDNAKSPEHSTLQAQPGDDVLVIGYPLGFFDTFNKLPVLKTGVLNTPLGLKFNGLDAFLLDFRYYPGSSGSLIISKPTRIAYTKDGRLMTNSTPQYLFLGVYQGEEVWNDTKPESADLGLGWYYYNVEEAINNPPISDLPHQPNHP